MIRFACPGCNKTFTVPTDKAGKVSKCPKCAASFMIPAPYVASPPPPPAVVPPPPPPPPPVVISPPPPPPSANDPIEIQPCPKCQSRLSVLAGDLGSEIECPSCQANYTAVRADAPLPPGALHSAPPPSKLVQLGSGKGRKDDDNEDDKPRRKRRRRYEDDDEEDEPPPPPKRRKRTGGGTRGRLTVSTLGVLSCGKILGAMYFVIGLLFALIQGLFMLIGLGAASRFGGVEASLGIASWGICMLVFYPVFMGIGGFVGGVLMAFLYNVLAGMMGGIEMDLE